MFGDCNVGTGTFITKQLSISFIYCNEYFEDAIQSNSLADIYDIAGYEIGRRITIGCYHVHLSKHFTKYKYIIGL